MESVINATAMSDEFVTKGLKNKHSVRDRKLHVFYEPTLRLETVASMQQLHTLVVIGQPEVTSVDAIAALKHLKELWIVECGVKDVKPLKASRKLQQLYLYANEIRDMPDLSNCKRLTILSLARNKIFDLTNLREMLQLQDINLADNAIATIPDIFSANFQLLHANFSGNPLQCLHDLENLSVLTKLQSIEFGDPLYGQCPVVSLCNYRPRLIRRLPSLLEIDNHPVGPEERLDSTHNELPFYHNTWKRYLNNGLLNLSTFTKIFNSTEFLQIKHLTITDCSIIEANFEAISLPHLESLDLSKNRIASLRGLSNFKKLHTLCVSHNQLGNRTGEKSLSAHSDSQICPNLIVLYADHNKLHSIEDIGFAKMPFLKYLFLQHNKIGDINGIEDFPTLHTAILDNNGIENVSEDSFKWNSSLQTLFLENNKFTSLAFVKHLLRVKKLFVANNKIADKCELSNLGILHDLRELTIHGNPMCTLFNHYVEIGEIVESLNMIDGHWIEFTCASK